MLKASESVRSTFVCYGEGGQQGINKQHDRGLNTRRVNALDQQTSAKMARRPKPERTVVTRKTTAWHLKSQRNEKKQEEKFLTLVCGWRLPGTHGSKLLVIYHTVDVFQCLICIKSIANS